MGDVINVWAIVNAIRAMREAEPESRLRYFAMPCEYNNKAWRKWFEENHPNVELIEQKPIPT